MKLFLAPFLRPPFPPRLARLLPGALALGVVAALIAAIAPLLGTMRHALNLPGLGLVLGGTLVAACLSYPRADLKGLRQRVFTRQHHNEAENTASILDDLMVLARLWIRADLRKLEAVLNRRLHPILRSGLQLLIHHTPPAQARELLHAHILQRHAEAQTPVHMLRAMAGFASAFGVLATVISLVGLLGQGAVTDRATLVPQFASALMATCYGLLCAALILRPLALRLERENGKRLLVMDLIAQGMIQIHDKRSPAAIRANLQTWLEADLTRTDPAAAQPHHATRPSATRQTTQAKRARPTRLLHGCHATPF